MPEITGYTFDKLYKNPECTEEQTVPFEISEDVIIEVIKE